MRKLIIRCGLVVFLILLGVFLYTAGKEHVILIDNRDFTDNGITYSAESSYEVCVDGQQVGRTALAAGKRNAAYVSGPRHKIELQEIIAGEPVGDRIEKSFKVATSISQITINIPALVAGSDAFIYVAE
ncbi:MAG: hypothetical protein GX994_04205 [Firmicutes bacterium]|nr:hypothetical protein [Bacillota bacterium]